MEKMESIRNIFADMRNLMLSRKSIFNAKELATYTGMSISTIYKLTWDRQIPHYKPGGKLLYFKKTEIDEWLLSNPISTREQIQNHTLIQSL